MFVSVSFESMLEPQTIKEVIGEQEAIARTQPFTYVKNLQLERYKMTEMIIEDKDDEQNIKLQEYQGPDIEIFYFSIIDYHQFNLSRSQFYL